MAIEKGIYSAPKGIEEEIDIASADKTVDQELEIEIVNPDMVTLQ